MGLRNFLILFGSCLLVAAETGEKQLTCGYNSCHTVNTEPGVVNVHLVPHSHDDVGWLKTVDQYYYGSKQGVQRAAVQHIIDSVVQELSMDPNKRFIQVETGFFWRWWGEQTEEMKSLVRTLVEEGRLEMTGGGWSMNDEATTHYSAIIDNMAIGLRTLKEMFGDCAIPKVAWQIDPFGHSREQASLFAQMGFDGLFFARIDYRDKDQRKARKELQTVWEGTGHLGEATSIFTGAFEGHYSAPGGFCFDINCGDDPIQDDVTIKDYNLEAKLNEFIAHVRRVTDETSQSPNHIMFTMGDDFHYQNAAMYYKSMDKLIRHMNERTATTGIHVLYSTPSCYIKAMNDDTTLIWPTKNDDFFPYASGSNSYWTGYFTSRPSFKFHERQSNALLQATKQVNAMSSTDRTEMMWGLLDAMAIAQHHDAMTGTAKQNVDDDYNLRLGEGQDSSQLLMAEEIFGRLGVDLSASSGQFSCPLLNISQCAITEQGNQMIMAVYNSLPRTASIHVRLPVQASHQIFITDENGADVAYELVPISETVKNIPGRASVADAELLFLAPAVPALGYKSYYIESLAKADSAAATNMLSKQRISIEEFQTEMPDGLDVAIKYYVPFQDGEGQKSGAYVFRPADNSGPVMATPVGDVIRIDGALVTEWWVTLSLDWTSYIVRQYAGQNEYEIEWLVGPIPIVDPVIGKEVIVTYYNPAMDSNGKFFTDANGRQMMERNRNERPSYVFIDGDLEPVSSNYYPITTGMYITSTPGLQMSVLTDRSQGGSSINNGEIELMVHRRLLVDDGYGVGEALNEMAFQEGLVAIGKHYYHFGDAAESSIWRRKRSQENYLRPTLLFHPTDITLGQWNTGYPNKVFGGLTRDLPDNVNILTLETWNAAGDILLRLEHTFQPGEDATMAQEVTVDLTGLFSTFSIVNLTEMTLGGNQVLADAERLHWNTAQWNEGHDRVHDMTDERQADPLVVLQPMQIRTYLMQVART